MCGFAVHSRVYVKNIFASTGNFVVDLEHKAFPCLESDYGSIHD